MNKIKGDRYEIFVRNHIINHLNKRAYLWKDIPEKILIKAGLIHSNNENRLRRKKQKALENSSINLLIDVGIDILQIDYNSFTAVQCKNGYKKGLIIQDLAGFYMMMANHRNLKGDVYYTSKLSVNIKENIVNKDISYKKLLIDLENIPSNNIVISPYNYQVEATKTILEYFKTNNKAILSLPCGTGKTYISFLISQSYDSIVILSPLKQFAKQNLNKYVEYGYSKPYLLIDSDGVRDSGKISDFIDKNNGSILLSVTFNSVDKIQEIIHKLKNPLIIIDEFHNLSKRNMIDKDDYFYKILNTDHKFLLMSATPRIYELENEFGEEVDLGDVAYSMSFQDAIKNDFICDYKIFLPSVSENNTDLVNDIRSEIDLDLLDNNETVKCMFLFKCLLHNGSKKCIVYCKNRKNINIMMETMKSLNNYYFIDMNMEMITDITSRKKRNEIIDNFSKSEKTELIFSVRILDECVDLPKCDSIYITHPSENKIRTIQRICRCIRKDEQNKFKIGNIYIWCKEYNEILNTVSGIKEYDPFFKDKISLMKMNWNGKLTEKNQEIIKDEIDIQNFIIGIKEFVPIPWIEKLKIIKDYIHKNQKRPPENDIDPLIVSYSKWISRNMLIYKKEINIMKNISIRKEWEIFIEEFKEFFKSNKEKWLEKLEDTKTYIKDHGIPSRYSQNEQEKEIAYWISAQKVLYKKGTRIMKNLYIKKCWENFILDYKIETSHEEKWLQTLKDAKIFMTKNRKKPSSASKDKDEKIFGNWIDSQFENYNKRLYLMKDSNSTIREEWRLFYEEFKVFFPKNILINSNKSPNKKEIKTLTLEEIMEELQKKVECYDDEIWKRVNIDLYKDKYLISNYGRVYSLISKKLLTPQQKSFRLTSENGLKLIKIDILVSSSF